MTELLTRCGMLDFHYWMWITAMLFVVTMVRDIFDDRSLARSR